MATGGCQPPALVMEGSLEASERYTPWPHLMHMAFKIVVHALGNTFS